jgi:hypothetical protein
MQNGAILISHEVSLLYLGEGVFMEFLTWVCRLKFMNMLLVRLKKKTVVNINTDSNCQGKILARDLQIKL